jgi:hypothetical protein
MAAIAFHLALWLFGGVQLVWTIVMLPFLLLLLRAERRAASRSGQTTQMVPKSSTPARL